MRKTQYLPLLKSLEIFIDQTIPWLHIGAKVILIYITSYEEAGMLITGQLNECRGLYKVLLEHRILAHELEIPLTKYDQSMLIPLLKKERESLSIVHSQVLQNVVDRLDKVFKAFFRRCKAGEKLIFPTFRGMHRYKSFCFSQSDFL
ncbi:MAG: hypothetical protein NTY13_01375 [Chlamydiae bacterium]|nr:hypothetical protein [Chlamydiota bacterium]